MEGMMVRGSVWRGWVELTQAVAIVVATIGCSAGAPEPADLVIVGDVITMNPNAPRAEALAARDGRLVAVGSAADARAMIGASTEVLELAGSAVAVPGLIEGHAHFLGVGRASVRVDLTGARSWDEVVARVAAAAADRRPDTWIEGRGWHQEKWDAGPETMVDGMPTHDLLSAATPDHPVLLTHASGHAVMVNAVALELAGIDASTADPPGGEIVRDATGRPTGVLRETADELIAVVRDAGVDPEEIRRAARSASALCLASGLTSFQDAGTSFAELAVLRQMADAGELGVRLWVMLSEEDDVLEANLPQELARGRRSDWLTIGGVKRYADGALGSHGAWLLEPYSDLPSTSGLSIVSPDALERTGRLALEHDLQLCTHAIGDRANRETLDVYERLLDGRDRRWRIEHAQHLHPDDVRRFAELGVVAAMQPVHCTSDAPWVPQRLGPERAGSGAYVWRDLLDSGATIVSGTDAPVEPLDPMATFRAAVTRRTAAGTVFHPEQAMSREEALASMTRDAAAGAFEEQIKGTLEVGKLADVTVLSADPLDVPEPELASVRVVATVVGGKIAHTAF
jgi:predicted amidohydrolase YtcJ